MCFMQTNRPNSRKRRMIGIRFSAPICYLCLVQLYFPRKSYFSIFALYNKPLRCFSDTRGFSNREENCFDFQFNSLFCCLVWQVFLCEKKELKLTFSSMGRFWFPLEGERMRDTSLPWKYISRGNISLHSNLKNSIQRNERGEKLYLRGVTVGKDQVTPLLTR